MSPFGRVPPFDQGSEIAPKETFRFTRLSCRRAAGSRTESCCQAKAPDEGDSAGVGGITFQPRLFDQKARDNPMDDPQHRREQPGMGGEEDAKPDRERE